MQELASRVFPRSSRRAGWSPSSRGGEPRRRPVELAADVPITVSPELAAAVYFCALDAFERAPAGRP